MESIFRVLFVGETWKGSSARSLREGLDLIPDVLVDEVGEDLYVPNNRTLSLRFANRFLKPFQRADLEREIFARVKFFEPHVVVVYKGKGVSAATVASLKRAGVFTVNVFPDVSPQAHGALLEAAMGEYDLVVSTKPYHPSVWCGLYGYSNRCVFVPHGYDPDVHFWSEPPEHQDFDVVLAASWRPQYQDLMLDFAKRVGDLPLNVGIAGSGWASHKKYFPSEWIMAGPLYGRSYGAWVRRGKIVVAPVHTEMIVDGVSQPGDQDSTRSYELAASGCFFVHRKTPYIQTVYDQLREVPLWGSGEDLAALVREYLPKDKLRREMALAAHRRAVPSYSVPARARMVLQEIQKVMNEVRGGV